MRRFLMRVPGWVTVCCTTTAAVALFLFAGLGRNLAGSTYVAALFVGGAFAALAVASPLLREWQIAEAARLSVDVRQLNPKDTFPQCLNIEDIAAEIVGDERKECLISLMEVLPGAYQSDPRMFRASEYGPLSVQRLPDELAGLTFQELKDLRSAEKQDNHLVSVMAEFAKYAQLPEMVANSMPEHFGEPDRRTAQEYLEQVDAYLERYERYVVEEFYVSYKKSNAALLHLVLDNETDKPLDGVQVTVSLPGAVEAYDPDRVAHPDSPPQRPRAFGKREPALSLNFGGIPHFPRGTESIMPRLKGQSGPRINISNSAEITFDLGVVRPRSVASLGEIFLLVRETPGTVIEGTWDASAMNADGRAKGSLSLRVSAPVPRESLAQSARETDVVDD